MLLRRNKLPIKIDDWKNIEKNSLAIALNVLYAKKEKIYPAVVPNYNSTHEKQVILLKIPNNKR